MKDFLGIGKLFLDNDHLIAIDINARTSTMEKILKIAVLCCFLISNTFVFGQYKKTVKSNVCKTHKKTAFTGIELSPVLEIEVAKKHFVSNSFIRNEGQTRGAQPMTALLNEPVQEVLFTYILLTDSPERSKNIHTSERVEARNHEHYLYSGSLKTSEQRIAYTARFDLGERNHVIINDRKFYLNKGQTLMIAPQKDGSLRFLQVHSPGLNSLTAPAYVEKLLTKEEVMSFFERPGNI